MDNRYSADTITIAGGDPGVVDHLNDILGPELRRPLLTPARAYGNRAVIPVAGADPLEVCRVLRAAATAVDPRPELLFASGTDVTPVHSIGRDVGHGLLPAELPEDFPPPEAPAWKPPAGGLRRPVIALFDSGVRPHKWLPSDGDDWFVLDADDPGLHERWHSPVAAGKPGEPKTAHATFNAGLIRLNAPSARILSIRVMNGNGEVAESSVVDALLWLERYRHAGNPVDVVLMPFGRRAGDEDEAGALAELNRPIKRLARLGVAFVASAGNDHRDDPVHPAAFDDVVAVGAGFGDYHATFSNYGPWVDRYREGVNALSIIPGGRWARWSGTSFSAAVFAADLARPHVV
jgi:hypothetical protein